MSKCKHLQGGLTVSKLQIRTVLSSEAEHNESESDAHATSEIPWECPSMVLSCLPSRAFQILTVLSEANTIHGITALHC